MSRHYLHLIVQLAVKEFKIRYSNSVLGYAWSVLHPLLFFAIYYLVFSVFARFDVPNYPAYLLIGVVAWNFFGESSTHGVFSLLTHGNLLTKAPIPAQVFVLAAVLHTLLAFVIDMLVVVAALAATGTHLTPTALAAPGLILNMTLLTLGLSLLLAPVHLQYHDVGHLWRVVLQLWFWLTPIVYPATFVPEHWRWIVVCNPMAWIIGDLRDALVYGRWPGSQTVLASSVLALVVLGLGMLSFQRLRPRLAEYY